MTVPLCPRCGNTDWCCVVCDHVMDDDRFRCPAYHPDYFFTCVLPDHNGPHFDMAGGHWDLQSGQLYIGPPLKKPAT